MMGSRVSTLFLKSRNRLETEPMILSYRPRERAMVPPDTPGMTLAMPMIMPLMMSSIKVILFTSYFQLMVKYIL